VFAAPIIYVFFNRPDVTRQTFARIRAVRPAKLHLISDGPRATKAGEAERCNQCREIVASMIDWPCEVTRDYAESNLGCGKRLSSGLTRAFAELGEGIVLEDDVLPHPDFFPFCASLLAEHRNNPQIHSIGGFNPLDRYAPKDGPTVPTMFNSIWGWASWQRSWQDYRFDISEWKDPSVQAQLRQNTGDDLIFQQYAHGLQKTATGELDSWDYQWTFAMLRHKRHALASATNFIENVGFSGDATHTHTPEPWLRGLRSHAATTTTSTRDFRAPDRTHDHLYGQVLMSGSPAKISLARLAARWTFFRRFLIR
jgi:hypothetical protein